MPIPIIEHLKPDPSVGMRCDAARLAADLQREHPELAASGEFRELVAETIDGGPTLHLDDLSEIARLDPGDDVRFYQERARLRAGDGDFVAACGEPVDGYEEYCCETLGLGAPRWLRPPPLRNRLRISEACWEDDSVRELLLTQMRSGELTNVHPHMGTFAVWELAKLLRDESGSPLRVIAPPPRLTKWVNNKVAFAETVLRLFGPESVPRTESAWNLAILAKRVKDLAEEAEAIGLKLPDAVGGAGNIVMPTEPMRGKPLAEIQRLLHTAAAAIDWRCDRELLVDVWETNALCSPSAQLWIPPQRDGAPIVEGIFQQVTEGIEGAFTGAVPAQLPAAIEQQIVDRCWLLAELFQRLGYVGRCSFDLVLVGEDLESCRSEFIECNGRWGGTSLPMTLMNRLFGDWASQPFAIRVFHHISGLEKVSFRRLLDHFQDDLFDVRTKAGSLVFHNPGRLQCQSGISAIMLGATQDEAAGKVCRDLGRRLVELARGHAAQENGEP
jgi:hypothetical protein